MTRTIVLVLAAIIIAMSASARGKTEQGVMARNGGAMMSAQGPTLLFFAADWCPTCRVALKDIDANGARLNGITVVVVDYDNAADLKRRYGVTTQHTFVQIDARGNRIAIWNGGGVDAIVKNAKRA